MSIENFLGTWHASEFIASPMPPALGNDRRGYFPPNGTVLRGWTVDSDMYVTPGRYNSPSTRTKIVKFTLPDAQDPLKTLLEEAEYRYVGDVLISTPIDIGTGGLYFIDVIEYVPIAWVRDPDDPNAPDVRKTMMPHTLLWSDGVRTMWWCCRKEAESY